MLNQLTPIEFLAKFDAAVHQRLVAKAGQPGVTALVLFQNQQFDSSAFGARSALAVGPDCTYKNAAACEGHWLNDLPSQRQVPQAWCDAGALARTPVAPYHPPARTRAAALPPPPVVKPTKRQIALAHRLTAWLAKLDGVREARPCVVGIGHATWPAADYRRADESSSRAIYCLGRLPQSYQRSSRVCYSHADDEWYIGGYCQTVKRQHQRYHPLGKHFSLWPWLLPEPIDQHARQPYQRLALAVAYITTPEEQ